ncbi:sugar phosphate isomerase/epimerase family protein [Novosphingobium taihuense]|uniref:Sugar phosphate isomerase/epimerase n=1 Tax=Novosphingobium taihuense TaxID=260085 RepID=A0A7W7ESG2_9SPHN|nr:sugar phosphate isomerase/epimerase [Novosphingobium taihuense]MBB4611944.1 sugar phosphate isomerase/epimerase [Novosphingobium taihuense]TWH88703.1 sugar phosphate isomerase/epimerase [Novosphingobium taihuense]
MMLADRRSILGALGAAGLSAALPSSARAGRGKPFFKRIGKPIGLQLYTLGDLPVKDLEGTLASVASIGFTEIELPNFYNRMPKDLRAAGDKAGVRFSSIHLNMPGPFNGGSINLLTAPQELADALNTLGIYQAFLPLCPLPEGFSVPSGGNVQKAIGDALLAAGPDHWKRTAQILNERAAALRPFGIRLGYHNHNMEFQPLAGEQTGWDILLREVDPGLVNFELDLGWVSAAGRDPVTELGRLKGRVAAVHVKDVKAATKTNFIMQQVPTEVGSGRLQWSRILPAAQAAGVTHYFVEQEPPFERDRLAAVAISHGFLSKVVA